METFRKWEQAPQPGVAQVDSQMRFVSPVITGLVGLRPRADDMVVVNPLVPPDTWDWFCLDRVSYHGRTLTILWDKSGTKYGRGRGLRVFADGAEIANSPTLTRVSGSLDREQKKGY